MKQRVIEMLKEVSGAVKTVPELTHVGNPVLRQKCEKVSLEEGIKISKKLMKVLEKYREMANGIGVGIAAPQIGISKNVFITLGKDGYEVYINPKIVSYSKEENFYRESCLSSRMMWGDVKRPESIEMQWTDDTGKAHKERFTSFKARLLQHEYDHLLGIVCLDKAIPRTVEYSGNVKGEKLRNV